MIFFKSFANAFYMVILALSLYYLFFITFELNLLTTSKDLLVDNKGEAIITGAKIIFTFVYLFLFFFILNLIIYNIIDNAKFDNFMYCIKKISAYLFVLPMIFMFFLVYFSSMLDTALKRLIFSLIPNLYALSVFYFTLKKSNFRR
ncbi:MULTISPECIES: hypothetical protein [unclassified Campylobacter]|uniref:hypothetical protein n=1 Tax=unclassified Campylobacter TaxID=2593542 RepID=UPI0022E9A220|nr:MULTISPECIES: hypothetical protein [unclassified Campylobacter]MDA3055640.1 hypothetical protein [Campylobacter sp. CN_NA1]MDA3064670.1 hypothetical protein [Campylobacter sp. CN_NE4]MDA3068506.1 hypothetical protein [Campylobacter sp. CN_NE3]MDA3082181.1 hypothetical protein [Campylobacter sp. CN_EL2]MDA3083816.1 hypothetical protein [Campylobacter sp. CN_NE1]